MVQIGNALAVACRGHEILRGEAAEGWFEEARVGAFAIAIHHAAVRIYLQVHLAAGGELFRTGPPGPATGIRPDPKKVAAVKDWPIPKTVHDVRKFLGFANYFKKHLKDFQKIAAPLNDLLRGGFSKRAGKKMDITDK